MYSLVDRPVECLSPGSRFALWAMRSWTTAQGLQICPPRALAPSFQGMGAFKALGPFHVTMIFLNQHARQTVAIAPVHHLRIGEDEAILLALWRDSIDPADRPRRNTVLDLLVSERTATIATALDATAAALGEAHLAPLGLASPTAKQRL